MGASGGGDPLLFGLPYLPPPLLHISGGTSLDRPTISGNEGCASFEAAGRKLELLCYVAQCIYETHGCTWVLGQHKKGEDLPMAPTTRSEHKMAHDQDQGYGGGSNA